MSLDFELYDGKKYSDLVKDIVKNHKAKQNQIKALTPKGKLFGDLWKMNTIYPMTIAIDEGTKLHILALDGSGIFYRDEVSAYLYRLSDQLR